MLSSSSLLESAAQSTAFPLFLSFRPPPGVFSSRTFILLNNCDHPVWPVIWSSLSSQLPASGFVLQTDQSKIINVPSNSYGRFWGRTDCAQNQSTGEFSCVTGDCGTGKLDCAGNIGKPPATLAEFSLNVSSGLDFYDVSLVDGYCFFCFLR
ncbi:hypothetical protein RHGRI_015930 [Rhododendron griersonianum]|uniref:Thaumatin-like protein n=1 Tax=Rhododendron griersonianum TaxID=479676 RepID=A0AAV6JRV0_9ERIC|nr:hypothetical protein RHGRI_015930 [Rhododendron griersonianum]